MAQSSTTSSTPSNAFADHFSVAVSNYRSYRPAYPAELFQYISSLCASHDLCVDAGTGNGQAAQSISKYFKKVMAFDPSETMIQNAIKESSNVEYFVSRGEEFDKQLQLQPESVDLVISATAVHWMNLPEFYANVQRVLKPGGILAVFAYNCFYFASNAAASEVIYQFHFKELGEYWPKEISYTTQEYKYLPFPATYSQNFNDHFQQSFINDVNSQFRVERRVSFDHCVGYLLSWSGTQRWLANTKNGKEKFAEWMEKLKKVWKEKEELEVHPLFMKLGRKPDAMAGNEKLQLKPPYVPLEQDAFQKLCTKLLSERKPGETL